MLFAVELIAHGIVNNGNIIDGDINIEVLYYDVRSMLTEDNLVNEDAMDIAFPDKEA